MSVREYRHLDTSLVLQVVEREENSAPRLLNGVNRCEVCKHEHLNTHLGEGNLQKGEVMKVKVSAEFFDRLGRVKEELEAVDLSREVIRQLRDSEWYYAGYLTMYRKDGSVTSLYFDDNMPELIGALNNLLEEMEVSVNA